MSTVEFQAIHMPACGLDVHKDKIEACVIGVDGEKHQKTFDTMRMSLYALRDWILSLGCLHVLMESTSVFWIPIFEILEEVAGMDVGVGNARNMKQVPGRPKTDKEDSCWIAKLCMIGLILKSFVVGRKFRELREYTRYHKKLVQERARQVNRIEKLLQMNGFKLSSVISDITGVSGLRLLRKLRDTGCVTLDDITKLINGRIKSTPAEIERAINGNMKLTSRLLLGKMLARFDTCNKEIDEIFHSMRNISAGSRTQISLIESIPGIGEESAIYIIAEIGTDLSSFKSANHLTAWAGLAPKDSESAGKLKYSKTRKANIYIKSVLTECAWAATKTRNTRISNWYWSNVKRLGEKKAITAVARKLLVYIYAMLNSGELYDDSLDAADTEKRKAEKLDSARKIVERQTYDDDKTHAQGYKQVGVPNSADMTPQVQTPIDVIAVENTAVPVVPKKRGRPRKNAQIESSADMALQVQIPINVIAVEDAAVPAVPNKRGRPRKNSQVKN